MRGQSFVLVLLAGTLISGQSLARDASGTTVGVKPDAKAAGAGGHRIIEIKGPIYMGDVITTDRRGQVQIIFVDDTKFVVGANSKVTIDAFVFNANKTAQDVSISAVKGAFRFITGKSPKDNYSIRTPSMTIGVRGTAFDLAVRPGESMVVVYEGQTNVCDILNRCMEANRGTMAASDQDGVRSVPEGADQRRRLDAYFPLINQAGLGAAFAVPVPANFARGSEGDPGRKGTAGDNPGPNTAPPGPSPDPDGRP